MEATSDPNVIDITPEKDGGVLKEIKREGSGEEGPCAGDKVSVHYVGTLTDGTKFDSSRDRDEFFEFDLGKGSVIKAWDIGVATMKRGELAVLTCKSEYAYGKNGSPPTIPGGATLIFEVELFDWKGEDVSPKHDGSILRSQLSPGDGYSSPNEGASVELHIVGKYDGKIFEERDVAFALGEGCDHDVSPGIEHALKKFKKGEECVLKVQPQHAFGDAGNSDKNIPPGASIEYKIKLTNFEKAKESWEMDVDEKIEQSEINKTKGTNYFKAGKYQSAVKFYDQVVTFLESEGELEGEQKTKRDALLLAAYLNIAMCKLKLTEFLKAISNCDKALALDATNEKGLFRRGQAYMNTDDSDLAIKDFKAVLAIDPSNKAAKNQLLLASKKIKELKDKEKKIYGGMFDRFAKVDAQKAAQNKEEGKDNGEKEEKDSEKESSDESENGEFEEPEGAKEETSQAESMEA